MQLWAGNTERKVLLVSLGRVGIVQGLAVRICPEGARLFGYDLRTDIVPNLCCHINAPSQLTFSNVHRVNCFAPAVAHISCSEYDIGEHTTLMDCLIRKI